MIGDCGSGKTNTLHLLISHQQDIGKIYLYARDPYKAKYQLLITKRKGVDLKHYDDSKACNEYSSHMDDIYENIEEDNPNKERKILIEFDDMIA